MLLSAAITKQRPSSRYCNGQLGPNMIISFSFGTDSNHRDFNILVTCDGVFSFFYEDGE